MMMNGNGNNNDNVDDFPSPVLLVELDEHEIFRILKVVEHQQPQRQRQRQRQREAPSPPSTRLHVDVSDDVSDDVDIRQCHCYQLEKWDCGVACLIMVHRWLNLKPSNLSLNSSGREQQDRETNDEENDDPGGGGVGNNGENLVTKTSSRTTRPLSPPEFWMRTKLLNDNDSVLAEAQDSIWTPDLVWQLHRWRRKTMTEEEEDDDDDGSSRHEHVQNSTLIEKLQNLHKKTTQIKQRWLEQWRKTTIINDNSNAASTSSASSFEFLFCSNNLDSADESYKGYEYYEHNFANDSHRVHAIFQLLKEQDDVNMILTSKPPQPTLTTIPHQTLRENNHNTTTTADMSTGQKYDSTTTTSHKKRDEHENGTAANNNGCVLPIETIAIVVQHEDCIAIVLLDNSALTRKDSSVGTIGRGRERSERTTPTPYMGHYVIVCGVSYQEDHVRSSRALDLGVNDYSSEQHDDQHPQPNHEKPPPPRQSYCFVVMNPAPSGDPIMYISPQRFEHAWRADGTDEDIIFVRRRRRR
mmetsp:Transcript_51237/g.123702  ORF Transcript_51237/g.123702 Transcript_51237/m.123702 type:complete len:525 (+) Transcript_51237:315-1889(+)